MVFSAHLVWCRRPHNRLLVLTLSVGLNQNLVQRMVKLILLASLFVGSSRDAQAAWSSVGLLLENLLQFWHLCRTNRPPYASFFVLLLVETSVGVNWLHPLFKKRITIKIVELLPWVILAWLVLRRMLISLHLVILTAIGVMGLRHMIIISWMPLHLLRRVRQSRVVIRAQLWFTFKVDSFLL